MVLACLREVPEARRRWVVLRELLIALLVLLVFLFFGRYLLELMGLSQSSITIAGGVVLFLIAIRLIFPTREPLFGDTPEGEPFIFPMAIPLIAGPSALATVMLFASRHPDELSMLLLAVVIAWIVSTIILLLAPWLLRVMGGKGIVAFERLMGLLLTAIAVEMIVSGIVTAFSLDKSM